MREPGWITKAEAAAILQVDERTIERRARAGKIATKARPGFPTWYRQADVEILQQTARGEVRTGLLETIAAGNGNGTHTSDVSITPTRSVGLAADDLIRGLAVLLSKALTQGPIGPTGPTSAPTGPTLRPEEVAAQYVTLAEASAIKGRTVTWLKRQIAAGTLKAEKDRGWRIRRKDLEGL